MFEPLVSYFALDSSEISTEKHHVNRLFAREKHFQMCLN